MTDFNFYSETYCGSLIPADAWDAVCRDAEAQMNRYERIYHVSYPQTGSRNMAVCAMAEALYEFAQLQDAGGAVQSVSVGNVSENRAAVAAPDTSAAAQAAELYRRYAARGGEYTCLLSGMAERAEQNAQTLLCVLQSVLCV